MFHKAHLIDTASHEPINKILNNIWLGNIESSNCKRLLNRNQINVVLRILSEPIDYFFDNNFITNNIKIRRFGNIICYIYIVNEIHYYHFNLKDALSQKDQIINCLDVIAKIIDWLVTKDSSIRILVHCKRGHHRSASAIIWYLVVYQNMSYQDALSLIWNNRRDAMRKYTKIGSVLYEMICKQNNVKPHVYTHRIVGGCRCYFGPTSNNQ